MIRILFIKLLYICGKENGVKMCPYCHSDTTDLTPELMFLQNMKIRQIFAIYVQF